MSLDKESREKLDRLIDDQFSKTIPRLKKELNVDSDLELEMTLKQQHTSLSNMKAAFAMQCMAVEWMSRQNRMAEKCQPKSVRVTIQASPEGVLLTTTEGTSIRADRIQLETNSLGKLSVEKAGAINVDYTKPGSPPKSTLKPIPTY